MDCDSGRKKERMRASIDIGSNTVLLLVGKVSGGRVEVQYEEQRAPRLGRGVDESGRLSDDAIERVVAVLEEYKERLAASYPSVADIRVTATSAVRDAANRSAFLQRVNEETGLEVEILSGLEEAMFTYAGAKSVLPDEITGAKTAVIDIGGGSTEIAVGRDNRITDRHSFDMGCVRFTERYLKDDPLSSEQVNECREAIASMLESHPFELEAGTALVGVAGTVTSLAFIDRGLQTYENSLLDGYKLSVQTVSSYISEFRKLTSGQLRDTFPAVMEQRADIFRAGLLILEGFMKRYDFSQLVVSTGGIRHGALLHSAK